MIPPNNDQQNTEQFNLASLAGEIRINTNVDSEWLVITEDKAKLCLKDHASNLGKRSNWAAPFSITVGVIGTFVTTEFKDSLGISASTWRAVFLIVGTTSFVWFLKEIVWLVKNSKLSTVDQIVNELKKGSKNPH